MNDSRIKEKDAARAVSAALNKEAVSKIDKSLSALAKKLDSKIIQAMGFVGLAGSVGSFAHPSFLDLPSASPELIIASAFISATVLAVSNMLNITAAQRERVFTFLASNIHCRATSTALISQTLYAMPTCHHKKVMDYMRKAMSSLTAWH